MDLSSAQIIDILTNDIGASLLRSKTSTVVIPFLFENYKVQVRQQIDNYELEDRLVVYLQHHNSAEAYLEEELEEEDNKVLRNLDNKKRAKRYIDDWCSPKKQYLKRVVTSHGSELYLDPSIDRLFSWIEKCQENQTVGAESRFNNILLQLRELKLRTNKDTESTIKELEAQKKEINEQIKKIKETGKVETFDKYQVQERLYEITKSSKELLGDFNQIRSNFQGVINDIYTKQSEKEVTRGDILGYTLDTNDELRHSPQGRSFTTFWNFISGDRDDEITELVSSIIEKARDVGLVWNDTFLYNLSRYFFNSGNQIVAQNRLLTSRINKMLSFRESKDQSRVHDLITDIKDIMKDYKKKIDSGEKEVTFNMFLDTKPDISFSQARFPVLPTFDIDFGPIETYKDNPASLNFASIFNYSQLDLKRMEEKAYKMFNSGIKQFNLKELTQKFPIDQGLEEVVGWFSMMDNIKHKIDDNIQDEIIYEKNGKKMIATVPRIVFYE